MQHEFLATIRWSCGIELSHWHSSNLRLKRSCSWIERQSKHIGLNHPKRIFSQISSSCLAISMQKRSLRRVKNLASFNSSTRPFIYRYTWSNQNAKQGEKKLIWLKGISIALLTASLVIFRIVSKTNFSRVMVIFQLDQNQSQLLSYIFRLTTQNHTK